MIRIYTFILLSLLFFSCQEESLPATELNAGYDYYPLEVGKYISYQVDSILYDPTDGRILRDTSSIQVRETITNRFENEDGLTLFEIERAERQDERSDWRVTDIYSTYRNDFQAVRTEENLNFLKMIFPVSRGSNWEGIRFDKDLIVEIADEEVEIFKNWESVVTGVDEALSIDDFNFEEVATIELARDTNSIELRSAFEQYAKGVGLIYREVSVLNTQQIDVDETVLWETKAEQGFLLYQKVIDFNR
ncbi:MAG: hypothetical protein AAF849_10670 [Bacteroidota bacterium]